MHLLLAKWLNNIQNVLQPKKWEIWESLAGEKWQKSLKKLLLKRQKDK